MSNTIHQLPPINRVAFHHLQALNEAVYGIQNGRVYSAQDMCMKITRYATLAIKGIRKNKPDDIRKGIIMAFSWTMAFTNRLKIDLDVEVWHRFSGCCPYCMSTPCTCGERASKRSNTGMTGGQTKHPLSVSGFQEMFKVIYPNNTLHDSGTHLAEEVAELLEAYVDYMARHTEADFEEVLVELVDVVANIFAVANTIRELDVPYIDIAQVYSDVFGGGCPKCHEMSCRCGFTTTADSVTLSAATAFSKSS